MTPEISRKAVRHMRHLVIPYLSFRIWFHWLDGKKNHMYGQEWTCTLAQVEHQRIKNIVLNREAGYIDCLGLAEKYNDRYYTAKIYSGVNQAFNKVHRIYKKGSMVPDDINDPVFTDSNRLLVLNYTIQNGIIILDREASLHDVDFKKELDEKLSIG